MKQGNKLRTRLLGLTNTMYRFPMTIVILFVMMVINGLRITHSGRDGETKILIALAMGAVLFVILQIVYEEYLHQSFLRCLMAAVSFVFMTGYYLLLYFNPWDNKFQIRSVVLLFILFILYLWVPTISRRICFNRSFMAAFQSFFITLFFCGIFYFGVCLILAAIDMLIFSVDAYAYLHAANIIFVFFAPFYYLSLVPQGEQEEERVPVLIPGKIEEALDILEGSKPEINTSQQEPERYKKNWSKASTPARFLVNLITFVIIPVTAVFTIILLLYLILNIAGNFWSENLLEPMLMSYSIGGIIIYLLASRIDNKIARCFRLIFPKILVIVVLFQTMSSIAKTGEIGLTYGRYYVLLFGIFATISGILFSIFSVEKNGWIAPILIILSLISIIPPADAFSMSRISQIGRMEAVLRKNNMLEGDQIRYKDQLTQADKSVIRTAYEYLNHNNELDNVGWMSAFSRPYQFEVIFGFPEFDFIDKNNSRYYYVEQGAPIAVSGYDYMIRMTVNNGSVGGVLSSFTIDKSRYTLSYDTTNKIPGEIVLNKNGTEELVRFEIMKLFRQYDALPPEDSLITYEEASYTVEGDACRVTFVASTINLNYWEMQEDNSSDGYFFIDMK